MFQKQICWLLAVFLALGMVASISGCKKEHREENSTLKLTFRGSESNDLKADVVVVLYGTDNVSPEVIKVTGADGLADFGNIGRTTATYTWAYKYTTGRAERKQLDTFIEAPVLNETIYIAEPFDIGIPTLVNVKVTNIPDSAVVYVTAGYNDDPIYQALDGRTWETTFQNFQVYEHNQNNDGKLTFLAIASSNGSIVKYGYLAGQTLIAGATYTVELTLDPAAFTWTSPDPVELVALNYRYKDTRYGVGSKLYTRMKSSGSGSFPYAKHMLREWGSIYAETSVGGDTARGIRHSYNGGIPSEFKIVLPDYDFESVTFNNSSKVWSWQLNGTSPKDLVLWTFSQGTTDSVLWSVWIAPDKTSFTVPTLPTTPSNINWFNWEAPYSKQLTVEDNNASGFRDFIRKWADQVEFNYGTWRGGEYMFPGRPEATAAEESKARITQYQTDRLK